MIAIYKLNYSTQIIFLVSAFIWESSDFIRSLTYSFVRVSNVFKVFIRDECILPIIIIYNQITTRLEVVFSAIKKWNLYFTYFPCVLYLREKILSSTQVMYVSFTYRRISQLFCLPSQFQLLFLFLFTIHVTQSEFGPPYTGQPAWQSLVWYRCVHGE